MGHNLFNSKVFLKEYVDGTTGEEAMDLLLANETRQVTKALVGEYFELY